jgi:hypothetical protein
MGPLQRLRLRVQALEPVVRAVEREAARSPVPVHDLELLGQHVHALALRRERKPVGGVLGLVPAGADAELDPPARDVIGGDD